MSTAIGTTMATTIGTATTPDMVTAAATGTEPSRLAPAALLQLIWLASPALPVGGYSYSEGLEAAIDAGWLGDEAQVRDWLLDQLMLTQARSELAVVAVAVEAWLHDDAERLQRLNDWVWATRESAELRRQCEQMGRSMLDWLRLQADGDARLARLGSLQPAPTWPLAWSLAAARSGAPVPAALGAMAFGWAENMVQAAVKSLPLGQTAGQRILAALTAAIPAAIEQALAVDDDGRQAFAPALAILSARHEVQYSRLFRS